MILTAEETGNSNGTNGNPVEPQASASSLSLPIQEENNDEQIISSLFNLKKYKTNRDVESAIVRLGRKGKTDEALELYHAMWTLDGLKHQYRMHTVKQQKDQEDDNNNNNSNNNSNNKITFDNGLQLPLSLSSFLRKSKLRPTTRLMNSAIDACSRSNQHPLAQTTAFRIYERACSPLNPDGTKKPGGALSPNVFTFGSLLACCARNGDVDTSLALLEVLEEGQTHPDVKCNEVIYSTVISACERADVPDVRLALKVLNRAIQNLSNGRKKSGSMGVVGFNAAVSTMAKAKQWRMAVQLLGEMILHSNRQDNGNNNNNSNNNNDSSELHRTNPNFSALESIRKSDAQTTYPPLLRNAVMSNTPSNAQFVIPKPDEVTFGTAMAACERAGEWEELLNLAKAAKEYGVGLDGMSLTSVLHSCQQLGMADEALEYLELMKHLGDDNGDKDGNGGQAVRNTLGRQRKGAKQPLRGPDGVAYRLAISACARAPGGHRWQDGIRLLDEMRSSTGPDCAPDVMAYTAAIAGCSEAGEYATAMSLIGEMRREGIRPNVVTFSAVINACASASAKLGRSNGDDDDTEDVKAPMRRALRLLEAMQSSKSSVKPNIVTYNAAIRACAEGLNILGAFDLLRQLKEDGLEPTIVTYGSLMTACERVGDIESASKVFRMVKEEERRASNTSADEEGDPIRANEIIYGAAISCCRKARQPERALLLLRKMISEKLSPNTATFNTVIAALSEVRQSDTKKDTTAGEGQLWEKALAVHKVMKSKHAPPGVAPNRQTYNILVRCLSANLQPAHAESMLAEMRNAGFVPDVDLYTMTVRSHERCGNPLKALRVMEAMREVGYDFYEIKVLDEAFKNGVRVLNRLGKGLSSSNYPVNDGEDAMVDGRGRSYSMNDEIMDFDNEDYRMADSL